MPKKIAFMLTLDSATAYELQTMFQRSELDFPTFLAELVRVGLGKFDYLLYPGTPQEYTEEVEEKFLLEWTREEDEDGSA